MGQLTENVLLFKNTNAASYKEFFKWVTASIKTSSVSVENNSSGFELAKLDNLVIEKIEKNQQETRKNWVDNNFVVLAAKCQNTKRPYLMKYKKDVVPSNFGGMEFGTVSYRMVGAYQVDDSYFELSDNNGHQQKINTEELRGAPTCPCCGNQFAFAVCSCGNLHCIGEENLSTCPWCNTQAKYGFGGEGGFDVNRTQG